MDGCVHSSGGIKKVDHLERLDRLFSALFCGRNGWLLHYCINHDVGHFIFSIYAYCYLILSTVANCAG